MKELSIEEKARAYDEAKYIMKEYLESGNAGVIAENTIRKAFPELAEPEDEKIRKELLQIAKESEDSFYMVMTPNKREKLIAWLKKQGKKPDDNIESSVQNKLWSEEDTKHLERILRELKNQWQRPSNRPYLDEIVSDYYWLNSLKDRVQPKQEWSEEDEEMFNEIILDLKALKNRDTGEAGKAAYQREIDWLKSLRPQSQWKPSDEQMMAIETAINVLGKGTLSGKQLIELQEDLKKLK